MSKPTPEANLAIAYLEAKHELAEALKDAGQIASMIDRRVSELLELADKAKTSIEANRFETKANEASNLSSQVRRGAWRSENDSRDSAIGRVESER